MSSEMGVGDPKPVVSQSSFVVAPPVSSSSAVILDGIVSAIGISTTENPIDAAAIASHQKKLNDIPHDRPHAAAMPIAEEDIGDLPPCQPIPIDFSNVCYDVKVLRQGNARRNPVVKFLQGIGLAPPEEMTTMRVLHDISGRIPSGQLCALMGASGAGKSTLLNVLSGRSAPSEGIVTFGGVTAPPGSLANVSAFVQQLDIFLNNLTASEHLRAQLRLRLPKSTSKEEFATELERLMVRMNLVKCRDSQISGPHGVGGISGGEKKRLNVTSEIVTAPCILFADEPTTGLDSYMATSICDILRSLAESGRTVIATVHQPSSKIFELFKQLILLGEGRLLYCGPRDGCVAWFRKLGHRCPSTMNPADFLVKIAAMPEGDEARAVKLRTLDDWAEQWRNSGEAFVHQWEKEGRQAFQVEVEEKWTRDMSSVMTDKVIARNAGSAVSSFMLDREQSARAWALTDDDEKEELARQVRAVLVPKEQTSNRLNWFQQVRVLYWRAMMANKRDKMLFHARAGQSVIMGLLYGTLAWRLGWDYPGTRSRSGVVYSAIMNQSMSGAMSVVNTFGTELPVIKREFEAGILSPSAYIIAKMFADAPVQIAFPFVFITIVHWASGARDDFARYLAQCGTVLLVANTGMSLGYLASSISPSAEVAPIIVNLVTLPMVMFGGFSVKISNTPIFLRWLQWLSFVHYGFTVSLNIIFGGGRQVTLPDNSAVSAEEWIEKEYEADIHHVGLYIGILVIMLVFLRAATCFIFTYSLKRRKENS